MGVVEWVLRPIMIPLKKKCANSQILIMAGIGTMLATKENMMKKNL